MRAEKDPKTGKWLIQYRYTDWQGKRRKSTKRGFKTKREAEEWLRNFLMTQTSDFDMKFDEFLKLYYADMETRLREHTMRTKKYIIELKILPYFGQKRINDIKAADIRNWQNELIKQGYSPTYLKTINNQLSAVFNYAVKYYDLKGNPYAKAGSMGKSKAEEMNFWTKEDEYYQQFQKRNPNLYVFSAHLHMDEATPHLHIDFVPFTTGSKRGLDTRVSLKQALAKQGFRAAVVEIQSGASGYSPKKNSFPLSWSGTALSGSIRVRMRNIYLSLIIKSRSGKKRLFSLRGRF